MDPYKYVRLELEKTLNEIGVKEIDQEILNIEKPKQEDFGDVALTAAMNLPKRLKMPPRKIAEMIFDKMEKDPAYIEKVEIAGPGFINIFLSKTCLQKSVIDIIQQGDRYGKADWGNGRKVQFEFVSANPTGPLNIVSARAAAVGDVLARLFEQTGHQVEREFYVNDAGNQIRLLGTSLAARYMSELGHQYAVPDEGYHGQYLLDLAKKIIAEKGSGYEKMPKEEQIPLFSELALEYMLADHKKSMERYRLYFDRWFRESGLREENAHLRIIDTLTQKELVYQKDGALWFKSSEFGDEKDRVLVTQEGDPTYFLIDIAYHETKYERGFQQLYDLWGPDHHGYIDRMSAALKALGHPEKSFKVYIIQQVNLFRGGHIVKMSKRAGEIIEMDELIKEVGVDAARYFFVDRRISQPLDFDIDLAKKQSDENPVYYVQYAHARICSILRFAGEQGIAVPDLADTRFLEEPSEMALIKKLIDYPETISKAAQYLEPHRITNYLHELSTRFHKFYHDNRVVTENEKLTLSRLVLVKAARQVLSNGLGLLSVTAPETM